MNREKYNRSVSLHCPTCAGSMFEYDQGVDETIELVKCASCGREITKDDLIRENSEKISEHVNEIGKKFAKDAANEFRASLKKAFRGNKHIKLK